MIISRQRGEIIDVAAVARSPMIYLDNWALSGVFANDRLRQQRLINALKTKGTLLFSWANIFELPAYEPVRTLLDGIGANWYPIEWNPFTCIKREEQRVPVDHSPSFSPSLLGALYPELHGRPVCSLSSLLDLTRNNSARVQVVRNETKKAVQGLVNLTKAMCSHDASVVDKEFPLFPYDSQQPARYVFTRLFRALAVERGFTFTQNDGMDLVHMIVPVAYADFVLLDKSWTQRVRSLFRDGPSVRAFYEAEIDQFLDALEQ